MQQDFYYSEKQKNMPLSGRFAFRHQLDMSQGGLIDGVEYTQMVSHGASPPREFDDYVLIAENIDLLEEGGSGFKHSLEKLGDGPGKISVIR